MSLRVATLALVLGACTSQDPASYSSTVAEPWQTLEGAQILESPQIALKTQYTHAIHRNSSRNLYLIPNRHTPNQLALDDASILELILTGRIQTVVLEGLMKNQTPEEFMTDIARDSKLRSAVLENRVSILGTETPENYDQAVKTYAISAAYQIISDYEAQLRLMFPLRQMGSAVYDDFCKEFSEEISKLKAMVTQSTYANFEEATQAVQFLCFETREKQAIESVKSSNSQGIALEYGNAHVPGLMALLEKLEFNVFIADEEDHPELSSIEDTESASIPSEIKRLVQLRNRIRSFEIK